MYGRVISLLLLLPLGGCAAAQATDAPPRAVYAAPEVRPAATTTPAPDTSPEESPRLSVSRPNHSFGDLVVGRPTSHLFELTNTGAADLVIDRVSSTCACVKTGWTRTPVPPGGSAQVRAILVPATDGRSTVTLSVASNAGNGLVELTVTGVAPSA
jgi:hypothetical protein